MKSEAQELAVPVCEFAGLFMNVEASIASIGGHVKSDVAFRD